VNPRRPRLTVACRTLALVLAALTIAARTEAGKRYALLIAINKNHVAEGELKDLEYAISDAEKLGTLLVKQGFETPVILENASAQRSDILRELSWHARKLKADDEFLLFYSGHGVRNTVLNNKSYWMTYGAAMSGLDASSIRLSHLLDYVREMKPTRKLVLLDHCFSGDVIEEKGPPPDPTKGVRDSPLTAVTLEKTAEIVRGELDKELQLQAEGVAILAAARHFAYESSDLKQGVFSKAVISALESPVADTDRDGKLSLLELSTYVTNYVVNYKGSGKQVPVSLLMGSNLEGWIFAPNLPTDAAGLQARLSRYEAQLGTWQTQTYITYGTMTKALAFLGRWRRAEEAQTKRPDADAAILAKLFQALDSVDLPDEGRGKALELAFRSGGQ